MQETKETQVDSWVGKISWGGNSSPLQYSFLGNTMDRGAWWATVPGVTKSQTWLSIHADQDNLSWIEVISPFSYLPKRRKDEPSLGKEDNASVLMALLHTMSKIQEKNQKTWRGRKMWLTGEKKQQEQARHRDDHILKWANKDTEIKSRGFSWWFSG